ncbi:MAG: TAXI family TRAP transporter solute-binding subunit [Geminicoccaceae bacterium]
MLESVHEEGQDEQAADGGRRPRSGSGARRHCRCAGRKIHHDRHGWPDRRVFRRRTVDLRAGQSWPGAARGIRCTAPSTGGSIANINAIREGSMDMGVAQSDWQFHAYNGTSQFEEQGPFEDLRAVFSVHGEPFNVIARADSGIETFTDLKGKRVNVGNPAPASSPRWKW